MGKALFLLVAASLALSLVSLDVQATTGRKTVSTKKQPVKPVAKQSTRTRLAHRQRGEPRLLLDSDGDPILRSASALVLDQSSGAVLFEKNASAQLPIASITKLMTAMVVLDAKLDMQEELAIGKEDVDTHKGTTSRLRVGTHLTREEMLRLALMASENRAAAALSRHYPGGQQEFIAAMNRKAAELGLAETHFEDPTGLTAANVSSARDLTKLAATAHGYPEIREFSTAPKHEVKIGRRMHAFYNTNRLVNNDKWEIGLSKTGYISEAGKCLVMQTWLNNKPMIIVLLDSWGKLTRIADANRIRRWIESASLPQRPTAS
ncbi:MAG: D-alanyl-D-alanine endopeptidase [Rhodocyclales bacterium]|nr:D-alanyl-D-alanine endopeptidase [Rhodocyclales bacterium]